jgi:hypothetical protein
MPVLGSITCEYCLSPRRTDWYVFPLVATATCLSASNSGNVAFDIVNRGNVPLYGIEVRKKDAGSIEGVGVFEGNTIGNGETGRVDFSYIKSGSGSETLEILPMIIGEAGELQKRYTCDSKVIDATI